MYSLAYGTIPIVRATGGLDDTIQSFDPESGTGNGFKFTEETAEAFLEATRDALALYRQGGPWRRVIANAMGCDFSWTRSAAEYEGLYREIRSRRVRH
jgi:starch synthase